MLFHMKTRVCLIYFVHNCSFFLFFFLFFDKGYLPNKGCIEANFRKVVHSSFFKTSFFFSVVHSNENHFCYVILTKMKHHKFFSATLKIVRGWFFLLFKKFNQNENVNVNLYFQPSFWCLVKS